MSKMSVVGYGRKVAKQVNGEYKEIEKANGVTKHGIIIKIGTNVCPTVYVDELYADGVSVADCVKHIKKMLEENVPVVVPEVDQFGDYDGFIKERLRARLYNKKTNAEVYVTAEPYGFDDLIIVPYVQLDDFASFKVSDALLKQWGKENDEVISTALENSKDFELIPMYEVLVSLGFPFSEDADIPLYVLSNKTRVCGAITAVTQRDMLKEKFPNGYKVIPSSVHEVLIAPDDEIDSSMSELAEIIVDVNRTQVKPEEVLGDHAYEF